MFTLLIKNKITYIILLSLLMRGIDVPAQPNSNLSSARTISRFTDNIELKEKIYELKYSDPNLAISMCLNSLEDFLPLGPSLTTLFLYSTLGELYSKKDLPVLALSYLEDAMYEYDLIRNEGILFGYSKPPLQPWLILNIGNIYFKQREYDKALERYKLGMINFNKIDSLLPKIRGLSTTFNNIALVHIELENYNLALENIIKAFNLRLKNNFNPIDIAHSFKSFSELYFKWNMQKKGNLYLAKTDSVNRLIQNQKLSSKYKDFDDLTFKLSENYVGNCYEYKGAYLFKQKRYIQALEAFNTASSYYGGFAFQKVSLMNKKANVYFMLSEFENCLKVIDESILLSKEQNLQNEEEVALELKFKVLNKLGLSSEIEITVDDIFKNNDYRYSVQIDQLLSGIESKNEIKMKKREIEEQKQKNSRIFLDKQMIIANQNQKIALSDLEHKKRELASISTNILQENEQISNILKDLKYYTSLLKLDKDKSIFNPLIQSVKRLLTEKRKEDLYSDQFNAAYPGYFEYLTRTYKDLTTSDLKLCTFLRMNLNTKEIADIMGLSVRSVESRRYRLRKKIHLSKDEDLVSKLISLKY